MADSQELLADDVKLIVGDNKPEESKELMCKGGSLAQINAALGEGCSFHYEYVPAVKEIAVSEGAVEKVVVVDNDAPPVLMLVFNEFHSTKSPAYFDGRILTA